MVLQCINGVSSNLLRIATRRRDSQGGKPTLGVLQLTLLTILYSFLVVLLWNICAWCYWRQHLQRLSPHGLHWPTVDEGLDTTALTSVSLKLLGRRNAKTGGSGNNLHSISLFFNFFPMMTDNSWNFLPNRDGKWEQGEPVCWYFFLCTPGGHFC